jgi:hypothetical protein
MDLKRRMAQKLAAFSHSERLQATMEGLRSVLDEQPLEMSFAPTAYLCEVS